MVLTGPFDAGVLPGASSKVRSRFAGVGVVEGEMKATFLCVSLLTVKLLAVVVVAWRDTGAVESDSVCEEAVRVIISGTTPVA